VYSIVKYDGKKESEETMRNIDMYGVVAVTDLSTMRASRSKKVNKTMPLANSVTMTTYVELPDLTGRGGRWGEGTGDWTLMCGGREGEGGYRGPRRRRRSLLMV
jgi:hypothetical protein